VLDDNLLACTEKHQKEVFSMLAGQKGKGHRIEFTGGLEAARLQDWQIDALRSLRPKQMFFAYDTPDDLDPLMVAGQKLLDAGFTTTSHSLRAYVLCGYKNDTFDKAFSRMKQTVAAGFMPMAMLFRDEQGKRTNEWMRWVRQWARPAIMAKALSKS
jgi:hypothetical protein